MTERKTFDDVLRDRDGYTEEEIAETRRDILDRIMDGEDGFDVIEDRRHRFTDAVGGGNRRAR